jgi:PAS domain S-box-containing protein
LRYRRHARRSVWLVVLINRVWQASLPATMMDILNSILNNIDQSVIITDARGKMLFFNDEAVHISEALSKKPLELGHSLAEYASDTRRGVVTEIIAEINSKKENVKTWAEYTQLNGLNMYLELNFIPVLDDDKKLSYISILARDITSSKVFEKKIKAQAENVENLIKKANAVIIATDSRGYITNWNDHCSRITGFSKDQVYTKKMVDVVVHPSGRSDFNHLIDRALNKESIHNHEVPIDTAVGKKLTFLMSATPQITTTGQAVGITFVGQDITELIEYRSLLEEKIEERTFELRQALKKEKELVEMKSRFVSIASHEFRTPLSSIQFAANFLKQYNHRIDKQEREQKLDNIVSQVEHMTVLLDDVLIIGKGEAGKINLITTKIRLHDFVLKIAEEVSHSTKNTHKIVTDLDGTPSVLETDEKLLRSILSNLLTNAIKFSPGQEKVYMSLSKIGNQIQIQVQDKGIGIPPDELDKIFEPFLRGKGVASIPGTGLGLSIAKKAVDLLHGTLRAESQPDKGTTFTVQMPYSNP